MAVQMKHDETLYYALFAYDTDEGPMVTCTKCWTDSVSREEQGEPMFCTECGEELFYPPAASW